jgi:hypothetical protein
VGVGESLRNKELNEPKNGQKRPKTRTRIEVMKSKRPKTSKRHASFSRHEIAQKLEVDIRTVTRRCASLGIQPEKRSNPKDPITYRLTPGDLNRLETPLARGYGSGSQLPEGLKQAKLQEEVENLRLKNKKLRSESTSNRSFAEFLQDAANTIPDLVAERLEKYAIGGANREPAELRALGKSTNDDIRAGVFAFLGTWIPSFEQVED